MQVRAVEFQESFRKVTLEGARQQNVVQRGPEVAQQQAAQAAANEQVLNASRPNPTTETEDTIIDPDSRRPPESGSRRSQEGRSEDEDGELEDRDWERHGGRIDLTA